MTSKPENTRGGVLAFTYKTLVRLPNKNQPQVIPFVCLFGLGLQMTIWLRLKPLALEQLSWCP